MNETNHRKIAQHPGFCNVRTLAILLAGIATVKAFSAALSAILFGHDLSKRSRLGAGACLGHRKLISSMTATRNATPSYAVHTRSKAEYRPRASNAAV